MASLEKCQVKLKTTTWMKNNKGRERGKAIYLNDIHKLVQLFYNLAQNLFGSGHNYCEESLVLVQPNSKGLDVVTSPSKNPSDSVNYTALIPDKHWYRMALHPETNKQNKTKQLDFLYYWLHNLWNEKELSWQIDFANSNFRLV